MCAPYYMAELSCPKLGKKLSMFQNKHFWHFLFQTEHNTGQKKA